MTKQSNKIKYLVIAALLSSIGIILPFLPFKIVIPPASYTLGIHVPIFIAMFISPATAIGVALITTVGFLISGFPLVIVLRALTHVVWAILGAYILKKNGNILLSLKTAIPFALLISVVHAICEVAAVMLFFLGGTSTMSFSYIMLFIGLGTIVHSLVDFSIAVFVWKAVQHVINMPVNARIKSK
ncbi:MAG: hypothetical protein WBI07_06180 [Mobilitalea sp.]